VRFIAEALERDGFGVWWDPDIPPGESFSQVIDQQLKNAKCIIAVWSQSSVKSNWVQEEADDGMMRNTLIPVMIDEIELPRGFKRLQTADLRDWRGNTKDPNWQLIVTQVRKLVSTQDADSAAEVQATARDERVAPVARTPQASSPKSGGFPVGFALLGAALIAIAGAGFYFFAGPGAGKNDTVAGVSEPAAPNAESNGAGIAAKPAAVRDDVLTDIAANETAPAAPPPVETAAAESEIIETDEEEAAEDAVAAAIEPGAIFRDCEHCPEVMAIAVGDTFSFGAPDDEYGRDDAETPQVSVTIAQPYAIGVYEVTYDEWNACLADGGCGAYEPPDMGWGQGRRPIVNISIEDVKSYLAWVSGKAGETYRLPSEAEWEFAARAGTTSAFYSGDGITTNQANFNGQYPYKNGTAGGFRSKTLAVGAFSANAFGLYDMHGNVWEWTQDCWRASHREAPTDGSAVGGACSDQVLKGGAWNAGAWRLRSGHRKKGGKTVRDFDTGFRVARDL